MRERMTTYDDYISDNRDIPGFIVHTIIQLTLILTLEAMEATTGTHLQILWSLTLPLALACEELSLSYPYSVHAENVVSFMYFVPPTRSLLSFLFTPTLSLRWRVFFAFFLYRLPRLPIFRFLAFFPVGRSSRCVIILFITSGRRILMGLKPVRLQVRMDFSVFSISKFSHCRELTDGIAKTTNRSAAATTFFK